MAIRITDAFKPGYTRVPLGNVAKAGSVGSAVLNQAQADMLGMKSIAAAPITGFKFWRLLTLAEIPLGGSPSGAWIVNEIEVFLGAARQMPAAATASSGSSYYPTYHNPAMFSDSVYTYPGTYFFEDRTLLPGQTSVGQWACLEFAAALKPTQIMYSSTELEGLVQGATVSGFYNCPRVAVEGSNDGVDWTRVFTPVADQTVSRINGHSYVVMNIPQ